MLKRPTTIYKDFDLSFTKNPNTKDIARRVDVQAVKQSLRSLLLTQYYEKPFKPQYGSPIRGLLFEPVDMATGTSLATEIKRAIVNYEPRVEVQNIAVDDDQDRNRLVVDIYFYVVGVPGPQVVQTFLQRVR